MSQTGSVTARPFARSGVLAESLAVAVAQAGNTELLSLDVSLIDRLAVQFNVTVHDLDAFIVQALFHPDGAYQTLYSASGDYTTATGILVVASGDLTAQAAATTGFLMLDVRGIQRIKLLASSATSGGSVVDVYAGGA